MILGCKWGEVCVKSYNMVKASFNGVVWVMWLTEVIIWAQAG